MNTISPGPESSHGTGNEEVDELLALYWQRIDAEGRRFVTRIRQELLAAHPSQAAMLQRLFKREDALAPTDVPVAADSLSVVRYVGDYRLLNRLGEGGMGEVYRAQQGSTGRILAVKLLRGVGGEATRRFEVEAKAICRLRHKNIITVFEAGDEDGVRFYSMDLCPGESLARRLQRGLPPPRQAAQWTLELARALEYAHCKRVLHRDLKPGNILFNEQDEPILADFGLAKLLDGPTQLTHSGGIIGTFDYMSPEQAAGTGHVTERSDLYSLGATLYQMLTGQPPIPGINELHRLNRLQTVEPTSIRKLRPEVEPELAAVCMHCLHKRPEDRYSNAAELATDLERVLQGYAPIHAQRARWLRRVALCWRRNTIAGGLAAAACCLLLVALGALFYVREQQGRQLTAGAAAAAEGPNATLDDARIGRLTADKQRLQAQSDVETRTIELEAERNRLAAEQRIRAASAHSRADAARQQAAQAERELAAEQAHRARLAEFEAELPRLRDLLTPMIASGSMQVDQQGRWYEDAPGPLSLAVLLPHCQSDLSQPGGGFRLMTLLTGAELPSRNDRPQGAWPAWGSAGWPEARRAAEFIVEHGDLLVERGLLRP